MMISKKMIVVFACAALLFTGCSYGTGDRDAKISNGPVAGETIGTAGNTSDMISQALEKTEEAAGMSNEVIREQEEQAEQIPLHPHYEQNDAYKLFYGTWEITDIVSESRYLGGDGDCEDILGMQVTYLPNKYEFGETVVSRNPNYLISILPTDDRLLFGQRQVSMDILLPDSEYFVWVQIADMPALSEAVDGGSYDFEPYAGSNFFLKDDNTLYLFAYSCIYELNRVSYTDDYDPRYMPGCWERW